MDLTDKLAAERRARLAAERKLELKSRELFEANRKLSQHALSLSGQIIEQRGAHERLKAQEEQVRADLERAEAHVEVVERRLWDSVETISDGFAVFDAEDRLIAANTAWLSIFRFSARIGPGTLYLEVLRCAAEEGHLLIDGPPGDWIGDMLERWDAPPPIEPVEVRTATGAWYRFVDRRARDGDMVCLAQDITALKSREEELRDARHRAEAANRAKSAFLANMSHELRTPMNGVVGMADMLLESPLDEENRLYASTIKSSGEALLEIINHVLDFSKMEAERLVLRPEPLHLERLLHEVVTLLSPSTKEKALELCVDYDLFLPTRLVGDAMRIRQILINLVGNAIKFTSAGHVLIRVVGLEEGQAEGGSALWRMHVTVEDTGIGIPRDMLEHIFGSFAQVESERNRSFEGTGLGLAITRQLVELMGGEIWVESDEGIGSCFGFRLTLPTAEGVRRPLPAMEPGLGRVLLVAPPSLDAEIMARQFGQLGLEVARAATGSEALGAIRERPSPQIVVIDDALPDTDGPALAAALAQAGSRAPRLVLCHGPHDAQRLTGEEGGRPIADHVDAVLTRPVLRGQLFQSLVDLPPPPPTPRLVAEDGRTTPAAPAASAEPPASAAPAAPAEPLRRPAVAPPPEPDAAERGEPDPVATTVAPDPLAPASGPIAPAPVAAAPLAPDPLAPAPATADPPIPAPPAAAPPALASSEPDHSASDAPARRADEPAGSGPDGGDAGLLDGNDSGPPDGRDAGAPDGGELRPLERGDAGPLEEDGSDPSEGDESRPPGGRDARAPDGGDVRPRERGDAGPPEGDGSGPPDGGGSGSPEEDDPEPARADPPWRGAEGDAPETPRDAGSGEAGDRAPIPLRPAADAPRPMRVLAAEDNKTNRFVLAKMLQTLAIDLHFAEDGQQAVEMFERLAPDLIFMDISMPRMDGKAAAQAIRAQEAREGLLRRTPIVAMTAHALAGDREEILASGVDRYLTKPLKRAQLVAEVLDFCPHGCAPPRGAEAAAS